VNYIKIFGFASLLAASHTKMRSISNFSFLLFAFIVAFSVPTTTVYSFVSKENISLKKTKPVKNNNKTIQNASLAQYAPAAATLFGNMIVPASILGGAIIPMSFASGLDFYSDKNESKFAILLRKVFPFASVASLASFVVSVLWSTITVNQLTENQPALAASVWDLLCRDYALPWAAVNSHFVLGMLGYMWLIATKAFFMGGRQPAIFGLAISGLLFMLSIVNRGVAKGGGTEVHRFGANIFGLLNSYFSLLFRRARENFGPLEMLAAALFIVSCLSYAKYVWHQIQS